MIHRVLGMMSGTSLDGVDAAIIETDGEIITGFGPARSRPYSGRQRDMLRGAVDAARAAASPAAGDFAEAEAMLTAFHAELAETLLTDNEVSLAGFPGQTLAHRPHERFTLQIGDGAGLAKRLGIPVAGDFRTADVQAGGQGAPFAPIYHRARAALDGQKLPICVLNIGGVANLTWIDETGGMIAFDTGPGNGLIDDWMQKTMNRDCDMNGALAAQGRVDPAALGRLLDTPFFALAPPKSLDRHAFPVEALDGLSPPDGAATLVAFTVEAVRAAQSHLPGAPRLWIVTGGGRHNPVLMSELADALNAPVCPAEAQGWRGDVIEAEAFALLAVRVLRRLPLSLPETTGVPRPLPGGVIYPAC